MTAADTRFVIPVLSAANFVVGMAAFMVIGMLNPLAEGFGISAATAGRVMIFYSVGYAVLSPVLVSLTGSVGRRRILMLGVLLVALSNLIAAGAGNETVLFAARVLGAAGGGLVTPVAAAVAAGLAPPERRGEALAAVFVGFTLSQVLGVPAGGFIAYTFGWQSAFLAVALMCLPVALLIWRLVPARLTFQPVSLGDLGRTLTSPRHVLALSFTVVFVSSTYVVYTYISPLLSDTMGFERNGITTVLLLFGAGAVAGNLFGGRLADRIGTFRTLALLTAVQALVLPWFSALPLPVPALLAACFLWSAFGWSFNAPQQARLIAVDPPRASVLISLNGACIYLGSAVGAWIGARMLESSGLGWLGLGGGLVAALSLVLLVATRPILRRGAG